MKPRTGFALFPFASMLALVACGSAGEPVGIGQSASTTCPLGYSYECNEMQGREVCGCVYVPPPACTFVVPPPPAYTGYWIESWAVETSNGQCNDAPGTYGTWKALSTAADNACFDGVPNEYGVDFVGDCRSQFPAGNCCTYVWWPTPFVIPTTPYGECPVSVGSAQEPDALCTTNGKTFYAIEHQFCSGNPDGCPMPGGGSCGTCAALR